MVALASVGYIFKTFIGKGGLAVKRLFKTARVEVNNIKRVNKRDLR